MVADQNVQVNEQDVKRAWRHSEGGQGMRYIMAWIKKYILHVQSPSGRPYGYQYEWDMLMKEGKE